MSLSLGVVLAKWKLANITPVFKKDDPTLSSNYCPISLLCVLSKVEPFIYVVPLIYDLQPRYPECAASGKEVDTIFLDLSKAFDEVQHNLVLQTLGRSGIGGSLLFWFRNYLTDRKQQVVLHMASV